MLKLRIYPDTGRYLEFDPIGLSGGPNGYIYVGGNPVNLTESGLKPIEEIEVGELVLLFDENSGESSFEPVTNLFVEEKQARLVEISLDSGKKIEATAEHPFYIKGKGWNPAGSLKVGQALVLHDGTTVVVKAMPV